MTGRIDRDLGTFVDNLGLSKNDECLEDRGSGGFLDLQELPKHLQEASWEPLEDSSGASWGLLGTFLGLSWSTFGVPDASRTSKSDVKTHFDANLSCDLAFRAPNITITISITIFIHMSISVAISIAISIHISISIVVLIVFCPFSSDA